MWNKFLTGQAWLAKWLGHVKFAVTIILLFAASLTYGTFMESYHGTDYANRLVYKSLPFMGLQLCMFLSILVATLQRFPMKRHLYGFYVLHLGLLILFLGSFITYQAGVDGNLTLAPNTPARQVSLSRDQLTLQFPETQKEVTLDLPYSHGERRVDFEWEGGIKVLRFIPFADDVVNWVEDKMADTTRLHSSEYRIKNDNFGETFIMSLHPSSEFESTTQLGPLNVHYMPEVLSDCFSKSSFDNLLVWDAQGGRCFAPAEKDLSQRKSKQGQTLLTLKDGQETLRFLPDMSPLPVDEKLQIVMQSSYRIFSRKLFQDKPHLFLFGKSVGYYDREEKKWQVVSFKGSDAVSLPWMGFEITLTGHHPSHYPVRIPTSVTPVQDNNELIKGRLKAVEVDVSGTRFWVTNERAMSAQGPKGKVIFSLGRQALNLPFEITLDQFKMDTDPGTNNPASYESFVTLFKGNEGASKHHVFMNNPMKHESFTFYQASYYQTQQGPYGSVFSVNYDPGRPWKYIGSLLLVLGSIWHFGFARRPQRKTEATHA